MEYKLINLKTKEETLCDKVIIDGWDYYVNFGWINNLALKENIYLYNSIFKEIGKVISIYGSEFSVESLDKCISGWAIKELCQKVIACNNPNIDLPQTVDEVYNISIQLGQEFYIGGNYDFENGVRRGYNESQKTHPFSLEDMVEFSKWIADTKLHGFSKQLYEAMMVNEVKTIEELIKIWDKQRLKTIYYE